MKINFHYGVLFICLSIMTLCFYLFGDHSIKNFEYIIALMFLTFGCAFLVIEDDCKHCLCRVTGKDKTCCKCSYTMYYCNHCFCIDNKCCKCKKLGDEG